MKKFCMLLVLTVALFAILTACGGDKNNTTTPTGADAKSSYLHECTGTVKLGQYKGITATQKKVVISDADIDKEMKDLLVEFPNYVRDDSREVGTEVKSGDAVNIDYAGRVGDVAFDGGTAKDQFLVLGSKSFIDGFEDAIVGKKIGDTFDIDVTFPDPYPNDTALSGAKAVFTITINYVGKEFGEVTDEYVKRNFSKVATTVEGLREYARKHLQDDADKKAESDAWNSVIDQAIANAEFSDLNPDDVTYYYDLSMAVLKQYAPAYGMTEEEFYTEVYREYYGSDLTYQEFCDEMKKEAERTVKEYLVFQEIVKAENLTLTDEEYKTSVQSYMSMSSVSKDLEAFEQAYGKDYLTYMALNDKALKLIRDNATIEKE